MIQELCTLARLHFRYSSADQACSSLGVCRNVVFERSFASAISRDAK